MARLRRAHPNDDPGIRRRRAGSGWSFRHDSGRPVSAADRERAQTLAIPPAWEDAWVCPVANGHLQAVGTDDAGRRQYLYHPEWRAKKDVEKFDRVIACLLYTSPSPRDS